MSNSISFNDYQAFTRTTAIYPGKGTGSTEAIVYCLLGVIGEGGEIADKVKKLIRGGGFDALNQLAGAAGGTTTDDIVKEIGDVLWYVARLSDELGVSLEEVARHNVEKLTSRKQRGVLHGSGDSR